MNFSTLRPSLNKNKTRRRPIVTFWFVAVLVIAVVLGLGIFFLVNYTGSLFNAGDVEVDLRELWSRQSYEEILSYTEKELEKDPMDLGSLVFSGFSHFHRGLVLGEEERNQAFQTSALHLRRALLFDRPPLYGEIQYILGKVYYHRGRLYADLALFHLTEAMKSGYQADDINEYLGLAYSGIGKFEDSLVFFQRALEKKDSPVLRWTLGYTYLQVERPDEAEKELRLAIETTDNGGLEQKCRFLLGELYIKKKDWIKADAEYQAVLETDPNAADAYFFLGEILLEQGEPEKARSFWRRAFQLDPLHYNAAQRLRGN